MHFYAELMKRCHNTWWIWFLACRLFMSRFHRCWMVTNDYNRLWNRNQFRVSRETYNWLLFMAYEWQSWRVSPLWNPTPNAFCCFGERQRHQSRRAPSAYGQGQSYYSRLICAVSWRFSSVMGPTPFEFVGNPTPLGEATPRGGGETAPCTMAFSDAERF